MSPSRIPAEKLIEELQSIADQLGRPPLIREIDELSSDSRSIYQERFGSWNNAVEKAGFEPEHGSTTNIEDRELLEELDRLAEKLNRTPRQQDMERHGKYSVTTYQNRFGSWNDALRKAGHQPAKQWRVDRDNLLAELRRLGSRLDSSPTAAEMDEEGQFSSQIYLSEFGSWNNALEAAGYDPNQPDALSRTELQTELERLMDELDRTPRKRDMIEHGEYSPEPDRRRFGSWNAALQSIGSPLNQPDPSPRRRPVRSYGPSTSGSGAHQRQQMFGNMGPVRLFQSGESSHRGKRHSGQLINKYWRSICYKRPSVPRNGSARIGTSSGKKSSAGTTNSAFGVGWLANGIRTNTGWISTSIIESRGQSSSKLPIKSSKTPTYSRIY